MSHIWAVRSRSVQRQRWTWAWFTPYIASHVKQPPKTRDQMLWRCNGFGSQLKHKDNDVLNELSATKTNTSGSNSREYTTESTKEPTKEPMGYCQLWITLCVFYACAKQGRAITNALEALHGCKTYLRNCTLSPSSKYSQTLPNPPSSDEPLIKIAKSPANMMMIWKTSVHITAFMPPCRTTCSNTSYKQLCYVYKHVDSCGKHMNVISFRLH